MGDKQTLIDEAWRRVPQSAVEATPGRFTRARVERIVQALLSVAGLVIGGQSFLIALSDGQHAEHPIGMATTYTALAAMILATGIGRFARPAAGVFAVVYVVTLLWWAAADVGGVDPLGQPWPYFLLSVAAAAAMIAFPMGLQLAWAIVPPLLFGGLQIVRAGSVATAWEALGYDVSIAILLNLLIVVFGWMFRGIANGVDDARTRAVEAFTQARVAEASERERLEIASLMHDSVLAALIAAARAETPRGRQLAVDMSREALTRLANAESDEPQGSDSPSDAAAIADEIAASVAELGVSIVPSTDLSSSDPVPGRAARALVLAATQAVANAVHHADGVGLEVAVRADGPEVEVRVSDRGPGLDLEAIPSDRLGIRASILARIAAVGGRADVASDAHGTVVTMSWHAPDAAGPAEAPGDQGQGEEP
ncbi:MAG: sensor histidine kinase [Microbacterium sp.]